MNKIIIILGAVGFAMFHGLPKAHAQWEGSTGLSSPMTERSEADQPQNNWIVAYYEAKGSIASLEESEKRYREEEALRARRAADPQSNEEEPWGYASKESRQRLIKRNLDDLEKRLKIAAQHLREKGASELDGTQIHGGVNFEVNQDSGLKLLSQGIEVLERHGREAGKFKIE